jgi:hypothetical protein
MVAMFADLYFRRPNAKDTARLMEVGASRGFSGTGMLGSIDCMHLEWKNCPFNLQGQYKGHATGCTVFLEAMLSQNMWIWHPIFGMVFSRLVKGQTPKCNYEINDHQFTKGYYLVVGIYPM